MWRLNKGKRISAERCTLGRPSRNKLSALFATGRRVYVATGLIRFQSGRWLGQTAVAAAEASCKRFWRPHSLVLVPFHMFFDLRCGTCSICVTKRNHCQTSLFPGHCTRSLWTCYFVEKDVPAPIWIIIPKVTRRIYEYILTWTHRIVDYILLRDSTATKGKSVIPDMRSSKWIKTRIGMPV